MEALDMHLRAQADGMKKKRSTNSRGQTIQSLECYVCTPRVLALCQAVECNYEKFRTLWVVHQQHHRPLTSNGLFNFKIRLCT